MVARPASSASQVSSNPTAAKARTRRPHGRATPRPSTDHVDAGRRAGQMRRARARRRPRAGQGRPPAGGRRPPAPRAAIVTSTPCAPGRMLRFTPAARDRSITCDTDRRTARVLVAGSLAGLRHRRHRPRPRLAPPLQRGDPGRGVLALEPRAVRRRPRPPPPRAAWEARPRSRARRRARTMTAAATRLVMAPPPRKRARTEARTTSPRDSLPGAMPANAPERSSASRNMSYAAAERAVSAMSTSSSAP